MQPHGQVGELVMGGLTGPAGALASWLVPSHVVGDPVWSPCPLLPSKHSLMAWRWGLQGEALPWVFV